MIEVSKGVFRDPRVVVVRASDGKTVTYRKEAEK